jgi:hypothetical protein
MSGTARRETSWDAPSLARALLLLTALAGLIAMHGLSDHRTADHIYADEPHTTSAMHTQPGPDPSRQVGVAADGVSLASGHMGEMDLCLAVLGAGLMLLLLRVRRPLAQLAHGTWRPLGHVLERARAPDPPDLVRLSIQRC